MQEVELKAPRRAKNAALLAAASIGATAVAIGGLSEAFSAGASRVYEIGEVLNELPPGIFEEDMRELNRRRRAWSETEEHEAFRHRRAAQRRIQRASRRANRHG